MLRNRIYTYTGVAFISLICASCAIPSISNRAARKAVPATYATGNADTTNSSRIQWRDYFSDPYLNALIDTALKNNQELNITLNELIIARSEVRARKGEYLPFVGVRAGAGVDKVPRYTNIGAMEANTEMAPGREMPEPVPDFNLDVYATWEIDIWHKLRNAKAAAVARYLSTVEGKNFVVTTLVAEIANSYYELLALDNQLDIVKENIGILTNALKIVRLQKEATRVTELGVRRFEAEVLKTKSKQYDIQQQITETENQINFLLGRYPQPIPRNSATFGTLNPEIVHSGIPSQLLSNRPDIKQAELGLAAAKLDLKVARAMFYPSLGISANIGYGAFDPGYFLKTPESLLYSLAGDLAAPLINRNAIKASYYTANAKQVQAVYNYERTVLNAYIDVANQLANIDNLEHSYSLRAEQVAALSESVFISNRLFMSARANYMEVLLTQREALEAKFELIETQKQQMNAFVNIYKALGGGWN